MIPTTILLRDLLVRDALSQCSEEVAAQHTHLLTRARLHEWLEHRVQRREVPLYV